MQDEISKVLLFWSTLVHDQTNRVGDANSDRSNSTTTTHTNSKRNKHDRNQL